MGANAIARYEYKYAVGVDVADAICQQLRPYCVMDEHAAAAPGGFYVIDSLYFDDFSYRCFHDAEQKAPRRFKLRVRTYGERHAPIVKFEVKRRWNDLVVKSSAVIPAADWPRRLSGQPCAKSPDGALEDFLTTAQMLDLRPKTLVRYERRAFRSVIDHYVRVTFDRRMQYQPMHAYSLTAEPQRWIPIDDGPSMGAGRSSLLLELKFITAAPSWLVELVRRFGLVRQGYSKYGAAVRRSILEARPPRDIAAAVPLWSHAWRA
jgi:hypothetical protein